MFVDETTITVRAGTGGNGMVHFRREKFVPRGGPDGGDGGKGGDVLLQVNPRLNTLSAFRYQEIFAAEHGGGGGPNNRTGKSAPDLIIAVPPGTVIYDADSGEVLGDLVEESQQLLAARGGRGGRGNSRFATAHNQAPRLAEKGEPGEEKRLRLELKLIADVGIVGVPNAGKSTFLAVVTNARPKIAPYPFTTLEPNLGVAELEDEITLVLADIPGLIEGAHTGAGLGHQFLRHIQRTRVLIHLLDGLAEDPLLDYAQINSELALFDPELKHKPQVVALNKYDLPEVQARWTQIQAAAKKRSLNIYPLSAVTGENVRQVLYRAWQLLEELPAPPEVVELPVYRPEEDPRAYSIQRKGDLWQVHGAAIERAAQMTYWENDQSVRRFQRILQTLGIEQALREAGVKPGDTVQIADFELEWQD
jgi:GTP-binding protein